MDQRTNREANRIPLSGIHNTRDLGGYKTVDGRRIAPRRLIRSGALGAASADDLKVLAQEYRLGTVIDIRTETERAQSPDPEIPGVRMILHPILSEQAVGITFDRDFLDSLISQSKKLAGRPEQFVDKLYQSLVMDESAQKQYGRFLDLLLEADDGAVLWHCSAGKDRAGIGTALLMTALGVDRETIISDFVITNEYLKEDTAQMSALIAERVKDPQILRGAQVLYGVRPEYLRNAFSAVEDAYGSTDRYIEDRLNFTADKKEKLRDKFLI